VLGNLTYHYRPPACDRILAGPALEYLSGYDLFEVDVTPEYAQVLIDRLSLMATVSAKDDDAFEIFFWDSTGDYYEGADEEGDDTDEPPLLADDPSPTECNQVVIRKDEVAWFAYPKHGDDQLLTEAVPRGDLVEIAGTQPICRRR
jgi:hypothetical protein